MSRSATPAGFSTPALASIGTVGDSYASALAESTIGLCKPGCTRRQGPWRGVGDLEPATLNWVSWFHQTRLHSGIGHVPPTEFENRHHSQISPRQQLLPGELAALH